MLNDQLTLFHIAFKQELTPQRMDAVGILPEPIEGISKSFEQIARDVLSLEEFSAQDDLILENKVIFRELLFLKNILSEQIQKVQEELEANKKMSVKVSAVILEIWHLIENTQTEISALFVNLSKNEALLQQLGKDLTDASRVFADTQTTIQQYQERKKELETWFWVPGYNLYLVGRTLDDVVTQIPILEKKQNDIRQHIYDLQNQVENASRDKGQLEIRLNDLKKDMEHHKNMQLQLIEKEHFLVHEIFFYQQWERLFQTIDVQVESVEDENLIFQNFLSTLFDQKYVNVTDSNEYMNYKDALMTLARLLDKRTSVSFGEENVVG